MIRTIFHNSSLIRSKVPFSFCLSTMSEVNLIVQTAGSDSNLEEENRKNGHIPCADKNKIGLGEGEKRPEYKWKKAKKMAAMISFSGKDYIGMQRNAGFKTIEGEFLAALSRAGIIDPEWKEIPQKAFFQRASRTDKGVSALKMVVSLKMAEEEKMIEKINEELPVDIKLQAVVRVTKGRINDSLSSIKISYFKD